jgi:uncharacterized membrane protein YphA (DoxX/SURF4 family)
VNDLKRASWLAVLFLVVLRIAIGWQFLYEGMWKWSTLKTNSPWTAEGYLKTAQGPLRNVFRGMTGDPDDLGWLSYQMMSDKWDRWAARFTRHYQLTEAQQAELSRLLDPPASFKREVVFPEGFDAKAKLPPILKRDGKNLVATGPIKPIEVVELERSLEVLNDGSNAKPYYVQIDQYGQAKLDEKGEPVPASPEVAKFFEGFEAVRKQANDLTFRQRLKASLAADPDRVGVVYDPKQKDPIVVGAPLGDLDPGSVIRYGDVQEYVSLLREYDAELKKGKLDFHLDHAERLNKKLSEKRSGLVGPIKAMDTELKHAATLLLNGDQIAKGGLSPEDTPLNRSSAMAMWGLLILGPLLILGLGTRMAAIAGAVMVMSFYLVIPPWPGVPQPPGPEHSLVVNKNLIEVLALLVIASFPTGTWFGVDAIFYRLFRRPTTGDVIPPKKKK